MIPVIIILSIVAVFLAVILIRAALFVPKDDPRPSAGAVEFDREAAEAALVRCRTVSYADRSLEDDGEFEKLIALLPADEHIPQARDLRLSGALIQLIVFSLEIPDHVYRLHFIDHTIKIAHSCNYVKTNRKIPGDFC